MTVVTLHFTPIERGDGIPWTQARIEEAPGAAGPWALVDTLVLLPLDADPSQPRERVLTTENATLDSGWYRVTFVDATGDTQTPSEPVQNAGQGYVPTVTQVAAMLQERTWADGVQQGTFTPVTTPTAEQAQRLIEFAADDVLIAFGGSVPDGYEGRARMLATLRAATLIENSFFRRDVENNTSPYAQYQAMYLTDLERLGEDPGVASGKGGFASVKVIPAVVDPLARLLP